MALTPKHIVLAKNNYRTKVTENIMQSDSSPFSMRPSVNIGNYGISLLTWLQDRIIEGDIDTAAAGDTSYVSAALTAIANRNHNWSTFDLTETFTTGDYTLANDGSSTAFAVTGTTGAITLGAYGGGTISGTPTFLLATDASGNIIETSSLANANNGLNFDGINVQLGGALVEPTVVTGDAANTFTLRHTDGTVTTNFIATEDKIDIDSNDATGDTSLLRATGTQTLLNHVNSTGDTQALNLLGTSLFLTNTDGVSTAGVTSSNAEDIVISATDGIDSSSMSFGTTRISMRGTWNTPVKIVVTDYTIVETDYMIIVDLPADTNVIITMPLSPVIGDTYVVKNRDILDTPGIEAVSLTINGNGNNIDGAATTENILKYQSLNLTFDGSEWVLH